MKADERLFPSTECRGKFHEAEFCKPVVPLESIQGRKTDPAPAGKRQAVATRHAAKYFLTQMIESITVSSIINISTVINKARRKGSVKIQFLNNIQGRKRK